MGGVGVGRAHRGSRGRRWFVALVLGSLPGVNAVCGETPDRATAGASAPVSTAVVPVTVVVAESHDLEVWETSVGQLESKVAPLVAAEVAGRLTAVNVDVGDRVEAGQLLAEIDAEDARLAESLARADIDRLEALIRAQRLQVKRYRALIEKRSVNQAALDDAEAQLGALRAERVAARVKLQQARRNLAKTRILSPIDGRVDQTEVSVGDYVKVGSSLIRIGNLRRLRARLPYPETLSSRLRAGLPVRLHSPSAPGVEVTTRVSEVRPSITVGSRSAQVIVNLENPGPWEPGATLTGAVRVDLHAGAVLLPEVCVIRRPAGTVVYVVDADRVAERVVVTGLRRDGRVEIVSGLRAGERVVADGAGFLTDAAPIEVVTP